MHLGDSGDVAQDSRQALAETLRWVRNRSPYYRDKLADFGDNMNDVSVEVLRSLAPTTPDVLAEHGEALRCRRGFPSFVVFTGGTTGRPRLIYGSRRLLAAAPAQSGWRLPIGITTDGGHHGDVPVVPGDHGLLKIPLRNERNYRWAWDLLTAVHAYEGFDPHVSFAILPLPATKKLVHYVLERGLDTSDLALDAVYTYAWYLSTKWRTLIARTLETAVVDSYGFTEIPTLATECRHCRWYHYGDDVAWEVVDGEGKPVSSGVGSILVTSLISLVEDLVLLRYDPGDLVALGPWCEARGEHGLRPMGRRKDAVSLADGRWAVLPAHVQELVDMDPTIARVEEQRFTGMTATSDDSFPCWGVQLADDRTIVVTVELKYSPGLFKSAADELASRVADGLCRSSATLSDAMSAEGISLDVHVVPAGTLDPAHYVIC